MSESLRDAAPGEAEIYRNHFVGLAKRALLDAAGEADPHMVMGLIGEARKHLKRADEWALRAARNRTLQLEGATS